MREISFSAALDAAKCGRAICRLGWNDEHMLVRALVPDEHSKMTLPYLYSQCSETDPNTPGARCPWLPSQEDIMAEDWVDLV